MAELRDGKPVRLFLALWPPPEVRAALEGLQSAWQWPEGAALVRPERLHVTLHFLGQVPAARVEPLRRALDVPFEPHVLALQGGKCRVWPGGIAVLELQAPPALLRLHESLRRTLAEEAWTVEERRFRPHVTLARRATGARPPAALAAVEWSVEAGYSLVRSVPGKGYETLHSYRRSASCNAP